MKNLIINIFLFAFITGGMLSTIQGQEYKVNKVGKGRNLFDNFYAINGTKYYLYDAENNINKGPYEGVKDGGEGLFAVLVPDKNIWNRIWGFMDKDGNWVIEPKFPYNRSLSYFSANLFVKGHALVGLSKTEVGIIDKQENIISRFSSTGYDEMGLINNGLIRFKQKGEHGLMNQDGEVIIEPKWYEIQSLTDNLIRVRKYNNLKFGLYDNNGKLILEDKYEELGFFYHGLSLIKKGSKYGYINTKGDVVIPIQYKNASSFYRVPFAYTDKGIIDTNGVLTSFEMIRRYDKSELIQVKANGKWGYMNEKGEIVIECQYKDCGPMNNGYALVKTDNGFCVIDKEANVILSLSSKYYYITTGESISEGYILMTNYYSRYGYMDLKGNIVIEPQFEDAYPFKEGLARVKKNGKWGYIDKGGKMVIEPQFEGAYPFKEGLARVKKNGKWGYIDKGGKMVIEPQFEGTDGSIDGCFVDGLACVQRYGTYSVIGKTGEVLLPWESKVWKKIGKHSFQVKETWGQIAHIEIKEKPEEVLLAEQQAVKEKQKPKTELVLYVEKGMEAYALPSMTDYVKPKVEKEINTWQKKDEFESTAKWKVRVNEQTRNAKIETLTAKYKKEYQAKVDEYKARCNVLVKEFYAMKEKDKRDAINLDKLKLSLFDADNESFMIRGLPDADILLSVKTEEAPNFKQRWETIKKTATFKYVPNGDQVTLVSVTFNNGQKKYTYDGKSNVKYGVTDVEYNFKPLELAMEGNIEFSFDALEGAPTTTVQSLAQNKTKVEHKKVSVGSVSDVDKAIPNTYTNNSNTFAVIIGNENYQKVSKVQFASNDAGIFAQYCKLTLGLPEKNIRCYNDATYATMLSAIKDIKSIAQAYKGNLNVLFYYAGHGVPNESSNNAYLLPIDTDGQSSEVCYSLSKLYQELGSMNAKSVVVFMDACFSGAQRGEGMLASARGIAIKAKPAAPQGNMVVFSAASGDETAYPYKEKNHGLFTYFLLKKLQETKGAVTLGELGNYIIDNVAKESVVSNGKSQTPTVSSSITWADGWKTLHLK